MSLTLIIIIAVVAGVALLCFLLAIANFSYDRFMDRYEYFDQKEINSRFSVLEYINYLNKKYFDDKIKIVQISNIAGDAYSSGKLFLSTKTLNTNSIASFTIVSHELGHALQDKEGNRLKKLHKLRKLGKILGYLMTPSIIAGAILAIIGSDLFIPGLILIGFGVLIFFLALIIKLATISIEKDASKKALVFLREVTDAKQVKQCKKFLNDARMTYWGDFLRIVLFWTAMSKKPKLFN